MASKSTRPTTTAAHEGRRGTKADNPDHLSVALAEAQAGSQHAYRTLYHDLHPRLLHQLQFLVGHTDAPDVASETWLHIITGIGRFRGGYHDFRHWVATIAHRRAVDHLRRIPPTNQSARVEVPDQPAPHNTETDALEALSTKAALAVIKSLPPEQCKIILLRVIIGFDTTTTARILRKRPGAIRVGTHRALRALADRAPVEYKHQSPPQN